MLNGYIILFLTAETNTETAVLVIQVLTWSFTIAETEIQY